MAKPITKNPCALIAEWMNATGNQTAIMEKFGRPVTWRDVWEYSPTGELFMIPVWYQMAKAWKESQSRG